MTPEIRHGCLFLACLTSHCFDLLLDGLLCPRYLLLPLLNRPLYQLINFVQAAYVLGTGDYGTESGGLPGN